MHEQCNRVSWNPSSLLLCRECSALEAAASLGGKGVEPFYTVLEGGRDGKFYRVSLKVFLFPTTTEWTNYSISLKWEACGPFPDV